MDRTSLLRRVGAPILTLLLVVATAGPALGATRWTGPPPGYDTYVALGDSYTSGPFIPFQRLNPLGCGRSTSNYPSLLALALQVGTFVDVSCAGARTDHMSQEQRVFAGTNPPQFEALSAEVDLVTIGIGGNDFGVFGDLVTVCPELRGQEPAGAPCRDHFTSDGVDQMRERITRTEERVGSVVRDIGTRAPNAAVYVIGYPRIVPVVGSCPDILPFADGDLAWLDQVEQTLNAALLAAAERAGGTYIDVYGPSRDHDACGEVGRPWIQGQNLNIFWAAPYHPNVFGMAGIAEVSYRAVTGVELAGVSALRVDRVVDRTVRASMEQETTRRDELPFVQDGDGSVGGH